MLWNIHKEVPMPRENFEELIKDECKGMKDVRMDQFDYLKAIEEKLDNVLSILKVLKEDGLPSRLDIGP